LRLLRRFFRSGEYLMSSMRWNPSRPPTWLDRWKKGVHAREVATLPGKLLAAARGGATPGRSPTPRWSRSRC
jgi:hypothetical protein